MTEQATGDLRSPGTVDRVLVIGCAVIWLGVIGVGVAATVALVDLGTGRHPGAGSRSPTPWPLYVVIAVSAVIILSAIPLLLRARRNAEAEAPHAPVSAVPRPGNYGIGGEPSPARPVGEAPTEKLRVFGSVADRAERIAPDTDTPPPRLPRPADALSAETIERMWLRVTAAIAGAMGTAMLAVAAATYLMAVDEYHSAWIALGVAGLVTLAMPVIPWLYLRQLSTRIGAATEPAPAR